MRSTRSSGKALKNGIPMRLQLDLEEKRNCESSMSAMPPMMRPVLIFQSTAPEAPPSLVGAPQDPVLEHHRLPYGIAISITSTSNRIAGPAESEN